MLPPPAAAVHAKDVREDDLVVIAHLRRTRGNKGELIADSLTSHPERFQQLSRVLLRKPGEAIREAAVVKVWDFRGDPVFSFEGVDSISAAELLAGFDVCVPASERVALGEGEFFFADITGCQALDADSGEPIGKVAGWQEDPSAGQVWFEVEDAQNGGKLFLVPFHRSIFREIDVAAKIVRLSLPEGMRDLN